MGQILLDSSLNQKEFQKNFLVHLDITRCTLEDVEINISSIHKLKSADCTGNIVIIIDNVSDKTKAHQLKIDNPNLKIEFKFILSGKNYTGLDVELNKLIGENRINKDILEFKNCIFNNKIVDNDIFKIFFIECSGAINILGNNIDKLKSDYIKVIKCYFNEFNLDHTDTQNLEVLQKSEGNYNVNNSVLDNFSLDYHHKGIFLKNIFIVPTFAWIAFFLISFNQDFLSHAFLGLWGVFFFITFIVCIAKHIAPSKKNMIKIISTILSFPFLLSLIIPISFYIFHYKINYLSIESSDKTLFLCCFALASVLTGFGLARKTLLAYCYTKIYFHLNSTEINKFTLKYNRNTLLKWFDYFLLAINGTLLSFKKCKIKSTSLINLEGSDEIEKIYFLIENDKVLIDTFNTFDELKKDKIFFSFEFILNIKNKATIGAKDDVKLTDNSLPDFYFGVLKIIYEPFYRIRNVLLPALLIYFLGVSIFNVKTVTIADTGVQIYIADHNDPKQSNGQIFHNIFGDEKTKIYAPSFYPQYSGFKYTVEKFIPFAPGDQEKYFRANNEFTDLFSNLLKILGFFYFSALAFILSKRFFIKE